MKKITAVICLTMTMVLFTNAKDVKADSIQKRNEIIVSNPAFFGSIVGCAIGLQYLSAKNDATFMIGNIDKLIMSIAPLIGNRPKDFFSPAEFRKMTLDIVEMHRKNNTLWIYAVNCVNTLRSNGFIKYKNANPMQNGFVIPMAE